MYFRNNKSNSMNMSAASLFHLDNYFCQMYLIEDAQLWKHIVGTINIWLPFGYTILSIKWNHCLMNIGNFDLSLETFDLWKSHFQWQIKWLYVIKNEYSKYQCKNDKLNIIFYFLFNITIFRQNLNQQKFNLCRIQMSDARFINSIFIKFQ